MGLEILRKENALNGINSEQFYNNYIRNDLCFNYPGLFGVTSYDIPKGDGGVRQFHFLELRLRILYYALGFYFLELTKQVRTELANINKISCIYTHYGAKINLDKPLKSDINYREDYQEFNRNIRRTVCEQINQHKVAVLHIDIQDFFNSITHSNLVQILDAQAMPESKLRLQYGENTKLAIRDILFLIMERHQGLPMSEQNIVSNLLSHLFLCPVDNFMRKVKLDVLPSLTFHRYVDDMFLTVQFPSIETNEQIGAIMLNLSTDIGTFLSSNLSLRLNPLKTRLKIVASENEVDSWIKGSRLISFYNPLLEQGKESPKKTLDSAIEVLELMKRTLSQQGFVGRIGTSQDMALKQCFQKSVNNYTKSEQAKIQLEAVFKDWNPALMSKSINVLVFLVSRAPHAFQVLFNHIEADLNSSSPSLTTIHLTEHLMLTEEYNNQFDSAIEKLLQISPDPYIGLVSRLVNSLIPIDNSYVEMKDECLKLHESLIKQIRRAVLAEKLSLYGLAYNHLLNAFQEWCYLQSRKKCK